MDNNQEKKIGHLKHESEYQQEGMREMFKQVLKQGMQPSQLADIVFEGIRAEKLYLLTQSDFDEAILARAKNITSGTNPTLTTFNGD